MCQPASANQVVLKEFICLYSCSPAICIISSLSRAISDHRLVGRYSLWKSLSLHCLPSLQRLSGLHCFASAHRGGFTLTPLGGFRVLPLSGSWAKWDAHFQRIAGKGSPAAATGCPRVPGLGLAPRAGWAPAEHAFCGGFAPCDFCPLHKS